MKGSIGVLNKTLHEYATKDQTEPSIIQKAVIYASNESNLSKNLANVSKSHVEHKQNSSEHNANPYESKKAENNDLTFDRDECKDQGQNPFAKNAEQTVKHNKYVKGIVPL